MFNAGDVVTVTPTRSGNLATVYKMHPTTNTLVEDDVKLPAGAHGVVQGVTSPLQGEPRYVKVDFDGRGLYVSEKSLTKIDLART